jgi:hypothetical protein
MHRHHDDDVRRVLDEAAAGVGSHRLNPERLTIAVRARRRQRRLLQAGSTAAIVAVAALTAAVQLDGDSQSSASSATGITTPGSASESATAPADAPATVAAPPLPTGFATLSPREQSAIQTPLVNVANALDQASGPFTSVFSGVRANLDERTVDLYVTDTSEASNILDSARSAQPDLDYSIVRVHASAYSKERLETARTALLAQEATLPYRLATVGVPADGSGLIINAEPRETSNAAADGFIEKASAELTAISGVHTVVQRAAIPVSVPLLVPTNSPTP